MDFLIYLLQVSACSAIFYVLYKLVLEKLTFYTLNRWYLLGTLMFSFVIPNITVPKETIVVEPVIHQAFIENHVRLYQSQHVAYYQVAGKDSEPLNWALILQWIYYIATLLLALRFMISIALLLRRISSHPAKRIGLVRLIKAGGDFKNGSFLFYVFVNDESLTTDEAKQVLAHEYEHVRRYHSIDKLFARCVQIVLWFNPFSYFYCKSIEQNHEFEVDKVVSQYTDKQTYAELLFKLSTPINGKLYHHFSKYPLKTRINKLFTKQSSKMKRLFYLLLLPVAVLSCIAFAKRVPETVVTKKVTMGNSFSEEQKFKNRNPSVFEVSWALDSRKVFIRLKNGTVEKYDLQIPAEVTKAVAKYGQLPDAAASFPADQIDVIADSSVSQRYRMKSKFRPDPKAELEYKNWRNTEDHQRKYTLARAVLDRKVNGTVISDYRGLIKGRLTEGVLVKVGNDTCLLTINPESSSLKLNNGDKLQISNSSVSFSKELPFIMVNDADIIRNGNVFQAKRSGSVEKHPFLYEANAVRFNDGQIKSVSRINADQIQMNVEANGFSFQVQISSSQVSIKSLDSYRPGDNVRLRFVHEVKTGGSSYKIVDWVSITKNIRTHEVLNSKIFFDFYERS